MESMSAEKKVSAQLARRNVNDVQARPGRPLPRPGRSDTSDMSDTHGLCGMQPGGTNGQDANISAATQTAFSWTSAKAAKDQFPTAKTKTTCRFHSDTSGLLALITLHQAQRLTVATSRHLQCGTSVITLHRRLFLGSRMWPHASKVTHGRPGVTGLGLGLQAVQKIMLAHFQNHGGTEFSTVT